MKSIKLSHKLNCHPIYKLPFGSSIYGEKFNDLDIIYIIPEDTGDFVLQYKDDTTKEDITYVGINQFINGLKNCSNVEFFEALHTSAGDKFLVDNNLDLISFYTTRMAKAYLGYAKRDLDYFQERLYYIIKSIIIAEIIIEEGILDVENLNYLIDNKLYHSYTNHNKDDIKQIINQMRIKLVYTND